MKKEGYSYCGFMHPDRVWSKKEDPNVQARYSKLGFKQVNKPLERVNVQSMSYYKPTVLTRNYQHDMPQNMLQTSTEEARAHSHYDTQQVGGSQKNNKFMLKSTTYVQGFSSPNEKFLANLSQNDGIKQITQDFKTLGFRKRPHENSTRLKQYELNRTCMFPTNHTTNQKQTFIQSFDNGYNYSKDACNVSQTENQFLRTRFNPSMFLQAYKDTRKSGMQISSKAVQAIHDR